ncbi:MAG: UPF0149 family protein [Rubrivivax sp.]|nr:UPF0149 family protein [Rubrivivax sp.]
MTPKPPRQNNPAEMQAFDTTCQRLAGFDEEIHFEWIDGFMAALAAGPRLPEAAQWLQAMFGDTFERVFADPEDHAQALRSLQVRLNVLRDQLDAQALFDSPDVMRLDPWVAEWTDEDRQRLISESGFSEEDAAGMQTGALWARGFLDGVEAFPDLWAQPAQEEAAEMFAEALGQIAALRLPPGSEELKAHEARHYPKGSPTRDDLLAEACMSAQDLRMFWVDFASKPETRRVEAVPGRNDPCPCGSGKKYKKCHGGAAD